MREHAELLSRLVTYTKNTDLGKGELTAWCAQDNKKTFLPVMALKFELVSLNGNESVGITRFLMRIKNPSDEIRRLGEVL